MCPDEYLLEDLFAIFTAKKFDFHTDFQYSESRVLYIQPPQVFKYFNCLYYDLQAYILTWCNLPTIGNFDTGMCAFMYNL